MKLYFFKQKALDMLEQDIFNNIDNYHKTDEWIDSYFVSKETPKYYFDTGIEIPDYDLKIGGPETDFENAKIIFNAYSKCLNPVLASDLRIWGYLAHVRHWDYMCVRWKIDLPDEEEEDEGKKNPLEKTKDRIGTRYFFKASKGKAFVRQGIARLFWSAYLTYDEENENPYEYTEYFFSKQDIFTSITERSFARNKILVLAALKELKKNSDLSREDIRLFLVKLNQAGAITLLDSLNKSQAEELCRDVMDEIKKIPIVTEGSTFNAINNVTGKSAGTIVIKNGTAILVGKPIKTKPQKLLGKKEGGKFEIGNIEYVIKDIK